MFKDNQQSQVGGDYSTNIQTKSLTFHNNGITYSDVKEIALDVFRNNVHQLSKVAHALFCQRAEEILTDFLNELQKRNPDGFVKAEDPSFQLDLFTVQQEYAKSGDKDLGNLLVDLLLSRTEVENRSFEQIVISESLKVASQLTKKEISALTVSFALSSARGNVGNLEGLGTYLDLNVLPFIKNLSASNAVYQHLVYARCASLLPIFGNSLPEILGQQYPGLFQKPKDFSFFKDLPKQIVGQSLHDSAKYQIYATNFDTLREECRKFYLSDTQTELAINFFTELKMTPEEIEHVIISQRSYMKTVIEIWQDSSLHGLQLTSVGLSLALASLKSVNTGFNAPLSIWLNK